jgi:hypothetical protein
MKFKGNNPIPETVHQDPDQKAVRYPERRKYPEDFKTLEEAMSVENDDGDPADGEGAIPTTPPVSNVLPFHRPRKPKGPPKHNM